MIKILQLSMLMICLGISMTNAQEFGAGEKKANSILNKENHNIQPITKPIAKPKFREIFVPMFIILLGSNRLVMSEYYRRATKNKQRILLTSYLTVGCAIWIIWLYLPNILDSLLDMLFNPDGESLGAVDVEGFK